MAHPRKRNFILDARGKLCDDIFGDLPDKQTISSYFENSHPDKGITVLNFRDNNFTQPTTIELISQLIEEKFPKTRLVDFQGNYFGGESWKPLKDLIEKNNVSVNINKTLLLSSPDFETQLSSFTKEALGKLIWLPKSLKELQSPLWRQWLENDNEKIKQVIEAHRYHYCLPEISLGMYYRSY